MLRGPQSLFKSIKLIFIRLISYFGIRLLAQELVWEGDKMQCPLFNLFDIDQSTEKIRPIFFNAPIKISNDLSVAAFSNGAILGGSNWVIKFGSIQVRFSLQKKLT